MYIWQKRPKCSSLPVPKHDAFSHTFFVLHQLWRQSRNIVPRWRSLDPSNRIFQVPNVSPSMHNFLRIFWTKISVVIVQNLPNLGDISLYLDYHQIGINIVRTSHSTCWLPIFPPHRMSCKISQSCPIFKLLGFNYPTPGACTPQVVIAFMKRSDERDRKRVVLRRLKGGTTEIYVVERHS